MQSPSLDWDVAPLPCSRCSRPMRPLFISQVCDFCDGLTTAEPEWDLGFVVWRGRPMPTQELVFATRDDAALWKRAEGLRDEPIVPVRAPVKFRWCRGFGSLDVTTADAMVTIYAHRRFAPAPNRAYLSLSEAGLDEWK